ncbi:CotY/CotZ family spore coat protein [Falsibacillus pallidus]|uniref:CotY/CotZ family spore coat protein n=1 Tax=Falsibacillus pallidus TaxID=493781 RepID=UPI003D99B299
MYREYKDHENDHDCDCSKDWKDHGKDEKSKEHHHDHNKKEGCVEEVLEAILKAQNKVKKLSECKNSCKESINDLLEEHKKPKKNTIPFILYCGCEPFKGTGVTTIHGPHKKKKFACITSFIFKIKDLDNNCATLELLAVKPDKSSKDGQKFCSPCGQLDCADVVDLVKTGICINVDLSCFCGITCLPAVWL